MDHDIAWHVVYKLKWSGDKHRTKENEERRHQQPGNLSFLVKHGPLVWRNQSLGGNPTLCLLWHVREKNVSQKPGYITTSCVKMAIGHVEFVWGPCFLDPKICRHRAWKSRCCLPHLAKKVHWAQGMPHAPFLPLFETPCPGLKQYYNCYGVMVRPSGLQNIRNYRIAAKSNRFALTELLLDAASIVCLYDSWLSWGP